METPIPFEQSLFHGILRPDLGDLSGTAGEFRTHAAGFAAWMDSLPEKKLDQAYAPGKWTARLVLGHVIDSHIMLSFRLLSFARGEKSPLPGNEEDVWVAHSGHERMSLSRLAEGYRAAAAVTDWVTSSLPPDAPQRMGVANGVRISVRELILYIIGHERHHRRILGERYGL